MKDLEAASVDDVRDFYDTYYVPENATLVLVGDFDTAKARELVDTYFGRVPKAVRPVPRDVPKEPPQTAERRVTLHEAWPLPTVIVAYHAPADGHPDSYPLDVAAKILTDGESSRIYQRLVYRSQIAVSAFGRANLLEDPNLFYCVAIVNKGRTPEDAARALIGELDRLKDQPVTDHELERSKNQFARDYVMGRQSDRGKALQLAHAVVIHHDITTADGEFDLFQNVSAEDVQRVARTYFTPENRTVITVLPR
jgi:zinc protease